MKVNNTPYIEPAVLKILTDQSSDFIGIYDMDLMPTYLNSQGMKSLGLASFEEIQQTTVPDFFFPEDVDFIMNQFFPVVLKNGKNECEVRFRHFTTGEPIWMIYNAILVKDDSGNAKGYATMSKSISKQKKAEIELRECQSQLQFAIDAAQLGTWDYNPLTKKFSSNERLKEWFGLPPDVQMELAHAMDAILESDRPRVTEAIAKAIDHSSDGKYDIEFSIIHPVTKKVTIVHAKGRAWFNDDKIAYRLNGTVEDITNRLAIENKIQEGVERYHNLIYSSPSAIGILYGEDLVITIANDAIIEIWGKGRNVLGKPYFEALPEFAEQGYNLVFADVYRTGKPFNAIETPVHIFHDGEMKLKYYNFIVFAQKNINGKIDGIGIIATEVTSQALLNNQIKDSEKKFRLLADSMPQHIWISDPEGNLNYYNRSVFDYSGLSLEQINKDGWIQIVHPDDRERNIKVWKHSIETGTNFLIEHRFRKYTGEYRWQLSRAVPQKDENGKIQMWVGTSTDIQEQKMFRDELELLVQERTKELMDSNKSLKKSEERYHLMVEEVQDYAILYLNRQGIVENWNTGAEKIKGYKASEIIGKSFSNFYTKTDRDNNLPQKLLAKAVESGKAVQEGWRVRKDGTLFWASVVITAVHDEKNEVIGFSKVTHDLTEKKNADDKLRMNAAQLEEKNVDLERMNKELQAFAYISSHDLQEPLRKIQTFASRILETESKNLSEKGEYYFSRMQNAALRMQVLINDLLTYSRTNSTDRKFQITDLNIIVDEVKADFNEELKQQHATIETYGLCEVPIIPFQFRQLIQNLVSNSLKFSNPAHELRIKISSEIANGGAFKNSMLLINTNYCHIVFSDNGIGFEEEFNEKIFGLFQRLHGREEYEGTGIGLAIVKKIVENHEGIITANGELNKGARFDIFLPLHV